MKRRRTYSDQLSMLTLLGSKENPFHGFTLDKLTTDQDGNVLSVTVTGPGYPSLRDGFGRALDGE